MGAPARREGGGAHVLGGGLPHRARHAHHGPLGIGSAPGGGEVEHELLGIVIRYAHDGSIVRAGQLDERIVGGTGHGDAGGARLDGGRAVVVAVHALAGEGDEERAGARLARVYGAGGADGIARTADERGARGAHYLVDGHVHAASPS